MIPIEETRRRLRRLDRLARLLEARWVIPIIRKPIGLDGLIGLLPAAGDLVTALVALGVVVEGARLGARKRTLLRMTANVGIDFLLGIVPLIGDYADILYRVNSRNVALLRADLTSRQPALTDL